MLFHPIVDRGVGKRRSNAYSHPAVYPLESLLDGFLCARQDEYISYGNLGSTAPPVGCAFSTARGAHSVLAVANEEGIIRLYNTELRGRPALTEWMAHENAIFDTAWVPGEASLVTASGDQMAKLWDVKSGELLGSFKGHQCSVKSISFTQQDKSVFCTGGRDGNIMIWDIRCSKKDGFYRQVKQISGAHNKMTRHTPSKGKKKRPGQRGMAPSVDSQQSVTVVLFRDEQNLISSGAVDGIIKMWDLRKSYTAHLQDPTPLQAFPYPGSSTRRIGYSGLVLDSTGSNLFSNCIDDNIYMFNTTGLRTTPVKIFSGHSNATFYVKSTVSPDNQFLASGSSDGDIHIWKIHEADCVPLKLEGHTGEVTSIAWSPTDFTKIASCSDDNTVRIWRLDRGMDGGGPSIGQANVVGWASYCRLECIIPAKTPRMESLGALVSPQPADCAPSGAALPLSSSTTSPVQAVAAKASPLRQRSPSSIKQWFTAHTPTPTSPAEQSSPPLRRVLTPCPQSCGNAPQSCASGPQGCASAPQSCVSAPQGFASSTPPTERKAKRRLESSSGAPGSCEGAEGCDGITELYPAAKRSRTLAGMSCTLAGPLLAGAERSPVLESADFHVEVQRPIPSTQSDKENSSPRVVDWLSMMGQRLQKGHGSPSNPRSPSSSKKQESSPRRMPSSPSSRSLNSMKKISSYFERRTPE